MQTIVEFLSTIHPPRNYQNIDSLNLVADFIKNNFDLAKLNGYFQEFEIDKTIYKNVVGVLNPHIEKRIIIGAHYDACGNMPAADDNASAVAVMIECARQLSKLKEKINCRIDFVAFTLEEPPYFGTSNMGSYIYAQNLFDQKAEVELMINLEMVGYFTDEPNSQKYPFAFMKYFYPSTGNFIAVVSNKFSKPEGTKLHKSLENGMESVSVTLPTFLQDVTQSDNINFWGFGFKSVMITDTAYYRNPNYHKSTDTIDTLSFDKMQKVADGIARYVQSTIK